MLDKKNNDVIENYHLKSPFSSFLPGINGEHGIPLWCYYVNRGQGIACFGIENKNHSIMEFYPAHQAYERTPLLGFRTFLKVDGEYEEAFSDRKRNRRMIIGMNSLRIEEECEKYQISVEYETLPGESVAALLREVKITNLSDRPLSIEAADGMAEIIPYGVNSSTMKEMGQTGKAWMQALHVKEGIPVFKVRASMEDSAKVTEIKEMNFAFAHNETEERLSVIADRELLFETDTALLKAWGFEADGIEELKQKEQALCNEVPCCIFLSGKQLKPRETMIFREIYGTSKSYDTVKYLCRLAEGQEWFQKKQEEANRLVLAITDRIATKTANKVFDAYCRQNYLDNLLRGGYPVRIAGEKTFYLYSRKHGDMERDYNFFSMLPEMYSQGNGNFRDVNQNRRCDVYFSPFVKESSIKTFYNALQLNGYNPLGIEKVTYRMQDEKRIIQKDIPQEMNEKLEQLFQTEFTPGQLDKILQEGIEKEEERDQIFKQIMEQAVSEDKTAYLEGYWCDHWTYNLDLAEAYLAVYPECLEKLLFEDETYGYRQAEKSLLPRRKRYVKTDRGIRQYHFLKDNADTSQKENWYLKDTSGSIIRTNLASKILTLIITKMAALDPYGMGLEMEGGKPGWYDALNGLPGLLGSSMAETYELMRCIRFLKQRVEETGKEILLLKEVDSLARNVLKAKQDFYGEWKERDAVTGYWNAVNDAKERFWEESAKEVAGECVSFSADEISKMLAAFSDLLWQGIKKAERIGKDVHPTYFYYEVKKWTEEEEGILPTEFEVHNTPDFLEGSVRYLKIADMKEDKRCVYDSVRKSLLYDKKLAMYKVNASLSEATFELGRACAFTPGWLENESVWMHMEYKYLLEILKADMHQEFMEDFYKAGVPFLDEETYGRSLLENSSFIASSANPNPKCHGKGFVARLSGSTAEFLEMWEIMMFGKQPFSMKEGQLQLSLKPCIPSYLIGSDLRIETTFLGSTPVIYILPDQENLVPGNYKIKQIKIKKNGEEEIHCETIDGSMAEQIREGKICCITVMFER